MIISINSPRRGNGQTTLAILLASYMANKYKQDVCLVDLNKYCPDIELSLSSSVINPGLDEFCMLDKLGKNAEYKTQCTKNISPNFYITTFTTPIYSLTKELTKKLINHLKEDFSIIIVDCSGMNIESRTFIEYSDNLIMPVALNINTVRMLREHKTFYAQHQHKTIAVINKHIDILNDIKPSYTLDQFSKDLSEIRLSYPICTLPFSMQLFNDNNNNTLIHFLAKQSDVEFIKCLDDITETISNGRIKPYQKPKRKKLIDVINAFVAV